MSAGTVLCDGLVKVYRSRKWERLFPPRFSYKYVKALDGLSFEIERGEVFGLLGPNGAGKTTTIQSLAGLLIPDKGRVSVFGVDPVTEPERVKRIVGVVAGGNPRQLYNKLTARENLRYWGHLYGLSGHALEKRIEYLLDLVNLTDRADDLIEKFSAGMTQRIIIARGLVHDPEVLLLDEPTVGLDPKASRELRSFIKKQLVDEGEKTVLLTTHEMHVAEELSDRIAIINHGKIIALDRPEALRKQANGGMRIDVDIKNLDERILAHLAGDGLTVVSTVHDDEDPSVVHLNLRAVDEDTALQRIIEAVITRPEARLLSMDVREPSLEDAFVFLTDKNDEEVSANA
ncbi:MAG: ABC transporter ATP-binding protein [Candidatus Thorarchaeota archaeon]|nr:ABC transporter ATP-binding protein [Candidatus Thorarchaeota archaeon]